VLVHEITHILEGSSEHSETGIMKARSNATDYYHAAAHSGFHGGGCESIRRGMEWRAARRPTKEQCR
jgi:hypothetical protein